MSESLFDPNGPSPQTVDSFLIDGFTDPDEILEVAEDLTTEQKKRWAKGFKDKLPGAKKRLQGKVDQYERERAKENEELLDLGVEILDVGNALNGDQQLVRVPRPVDIQLVLHGLQERHLA